MNKKPNKSEYSTPKEEDEEIRASVAMVEEYHENRWFDKCIDSINELLKKPMLDATRANLLFLRGYSFWKLCQLEQTENDFLEAEKMTATKGSRSQHLGFVAAVANFYSSLGEKHKDNPEKKKYYQDLSLERATYCVNNGHDHKYFQHNNIADILAERKQYDEAINSYKRAIKVEPKDFWAYKGIANIYLEKEQYANAIEYFDEAIRLLEEKVPSNDTKRSQFLKDIEKMKESQKKAYESLSVSGQKAMLLPEKEQQEEEEKSITSKEIKFIQSFEFSDSALEVLISTNEDPTLEITSKKLSTNHEFEIIRRNSEGNVYIVHTATGLALTAIDSIDDNDSKNKTSLDSKLTEIVVSSDKSPNIALLELKQSPYQLWRIETEDTAQSKITSVANGKKLCAIYENDKKNKFLTKKMKISEAGRIRLQEKVENGIDSWRISPVNST